jgi:hypothetical protein
MMLNRRTISACVLVALFALPTPGRAQTPASPMMQPAPQQQLIQAEKDRFAAMVKVDQAALNRLLGDELTYIHSSALLQTKAEFIGDLKSGAIKYITITPNEPDWKVRIMGNIAVVTGTAAVHVVDHGNDLNIRIRYTNVHINRGGAWQMVAWQATRFPA